MGNNLNPDNIKEGDDVYFECHINANPVVRHVSWLHNVSIADREGKYGLGAVSLGLAPCSQEFPHVRAPRQVICKPYCREVTNIPVTRLRRCEFSVPRCLPKS
ncbi:hypothetical protein E2C01_080454 [Portunus trituberculatus]|uniref:Ig-like domain-containing protein n=1 Tax=Portunus trituberculatus TaxID=210409 RepID=A0A5B7IJS3_PORTR|nr:hypothetical protein [Portunus trituberculatus]